MFHKCDDHTMSNRDKIEGHAEVLFKAVMFECEG